MIKYPDYAKATNAAYEALIKFKEFEFPVGTFRIFRQLDNTKLYTYEELSKRFGVSLQALVASSSNYGYNLFNINKKRYAVAYNSNKDETTVRFTLAHELGHVILGHMDDGEAENKEANCFSRNFLCPIPAVDFFDINTIYDYQDVFNVSEPMAETSLKWYDNDKYYISVKNYSEYWNELNRKFLKINMNDVYDFPSGY